MNITRTYTSELTNITDPVQFLTGLNNGMNGILAITGLFTTWIILTILLLNNGYSFKRSFSASSYAGFIMAWLFWILDMINAKWLYAFLILFAAGVASMWVRRD